MKLIEKVFGEVDFYVNPRIWGARPECKNCISFSSKAVMDCLKQGDPYTSPIVPEESEGRCIYFKEKLVKPSVVQTVATKISSIIR